MAYTKIHAIKATLNKAINYITNPSKTDGKMLVDSFACSPESADIEFDFALKKTLTAGFNKAFHLIQSFMPGEVSYDEAHMIGKELADRLLDGKYSYVIATHIDHNHIHNHIIFCAADNIQHRKYDDNKRSYYHIRRLSDELCTEHNLSVIKPGQKRGMKYNEWAARKDNNSYKEKLTKDIDDTISVAKSYEDFIDLMNARGYEIKGEDFGESASKYIAFRPLESKQFIRGSARSLGDSYTKESIRSRITDVHKSQTRRKTPFPKRPDEPDGIKITTMENIISRSPRSITESPRSSLIDTTTDKMLSSPGLLRWANVQNLKAAAHAYTVMEEPQNIQERIAVKKELIKTAKSSLVELEKKMKPAAEILHYAEMYRSNLRYHNAMERSKDPDRYYREHDTQINLFNAAEYVLQNKYGINPAKMNYHNMIEGYRLMEDKKSALSSSWKQYESELHELESQLDTLHKYLGQTSAESMHSHIHEENHEEETKQLENEKSQSNRNNQSL